jgi:hypothetical protein
MSHAKLFSKYSKRNMPKICPNTNGKNDIIPLRGSSTQKGRNKFFSKQILLMSTFLNMQLRKEYM